MAKIGRPKRIEPIGKKHFIRIGLDEEAHKDLAKIADKLGLAVHSYAKALIMQQILTSKTQPNKQKAFL